MNVICPYCGAPHWESEHLTKSSHANSKFGGCDFHTNIQKYNNALAMTSVGRNLQQNDGGGAYVFKVHGSLLPPPDQSPVYAQLYIYDPDEALNYRMDNQINAGLNRTVMRDLQDMLHRHHHRVTLYKQALELTRDMPQDHQCKIALQYLPGTDRCCYNLPTISGEVAAVVPGTGEDFSNSQDIILYRKEGALKRISEVHPFYPSLHYVLLFPHGQMDWHPKIPYYVPRIGDQHQKTAEQSCLSMREFLAYHFHP